MIDREEVKPTVLVVAYAFPPVGGAGVQRPLKFVKHLRQFGWEPAVLTVDNPSVPVMDDGLLSEIPAGVRVFKATTLEPSYQKKQTFTKECKATILSHLKGLVVRFLVPDAQVLWWPGLTGQLIRVLLSIKPRVIFVTAPPFSSLLPVIAIARLFAVPVVADFRDEWAFSREQIENANRAGFIRTLDFLLEKFVVTFCDDFSAATQSYVDSIHQRHPRLDSKKGCAITNGYDDDDFHSDSQCAQSDRLRIVYAGTVWKATSLQQFAESIKKAVVAAPHISRLLEIKILGRIVETETQHLNDPLLEPFLHFSGYLDHTSVIKEIHDSDLLLLTLNDLPGAERIIPGKTFEYMATGKPILGIMPAGEAYNLLKKDYPGSYLFHPGDVTAIAGLLIELAQDKSLLVEKQMAPPLEYSRYFLTAKLVQVFENVIKFNRISRGVHETSQDCQRNS